MLQQKLDGWELYGGIATRVARRDVRTLFQQLLQHRPTTASTIKGK